MSAIHPTQPIPTDVANGSYGGMGCHCHRRTRAAAERIGRVKPGQQSQPNSLAAASATRAASRRRDATGKIRAANAPLENRNCKGAIGTSSPAVLLSVLPYNRGGFLGAAQ